jgi:thiol-disulfide isomerase/thioredoxin
MSRPTLWLVAGMVGFCFGCSAQDRPRAAHTTAKAGSGAPAVVAITASELKAIAARPGARATLVNVWATWCGPCRQEFPALIKVGKDRKTDGLRLVLVSADFEEQLGEVRQFLVARGVSDTAYIMTGEPNAFINSMNPKWTGALPATFVYNGRGELASFWEGAVDEAHFNRSVDQAIATP